MLSKKKLAKELEKLAGKFVEPKERGALFESLKGDKTEWFQWVSRMKMILKRLDKTDALKFSGLLLLLEQNSESRFHQDNMKKFLIEKTEFYKYYDFSLDKELNRQKMARKKLWISKILRLFISRSFLGILILGAVLVFIGWFYADRESCLEFVQKVVGPFFKAIR
ncbi:MAG: hypothetical protein U9R14_04005 [Patescibacteria group bacterium]|nr:hypothetical protein [Patescibacteria group bacterium]